MSLRAIWAFDTTVKEIVPPKDGVMAPCRGFIMDRCGMPHKDGSFTVDSEILSIWKINTVPSLWLFEDGWCRSVVYFHKEKELVVGIPGPEGKKYLEKVLGME